MEWKSESIANKTKVVSRRISWLFFPMFFIGAGLMTEVARIDGLKLLGSLSPFVGGTSLILLAISWLMPGVFLLLGVPWLAHAWLRGINPIAVPSTPWEQMSPGGKIFVYFHSILTVVSYFDQRVLPVVNCPTQRAPDGWESARFQAVCVAWSWFRQSGVVSSRPPAGNAHRWVLAKALPYLMSE
jgi:hypothetical protein